MPRISMCDSCAGLAMQGKPRKIANNTFQYTAPDGAQVIRLHTTDIIKKYPDGKVRLNSGGWKTHTTKERLDAMSGYRVWQEKGIWWVSDTHQRTPFFDNMLLPDAFDQPINTAPQIELGKAINAFVKQLDDMAELPQPSNGDCWCCAMHPTDPEPGYIPGTVMGTDHLRSHIEENYLPGFLLVNAMRWRGYHDAGIATHYQMNLRASFKSALRRYLRFNLGLAV